MMRINLVSYPVSYPSETGVLGNHEIGNQSGNFGKLTEVKLLKSFKAAGNQKGNSWKQFPVVSSPICIGRKLETFPFKGVNKQWLFPT